MKKLLTIIAILEGTTGVGLIIVPKVVVTALLGALLHEPAGIFASRLTGVALMTLSIICWSYRNNEPGVQGIVKALMFYNVAAAALLLVASMNGYSGFATWPAFLLHVGFAIWCIKFSL